MPDAVASRIIQKDVVANMKTGNLDAAVNSATADMVRCFPTRHTPKSCKAVSEEMRLE